MIDVMKYYEKLIRVNPEVKRCIYSFKKADIAKKMLFLSEKRLKKTKYFDDVKEIIGKMSNELKKFLKYKDTYTIDKKRDVITQMKEIFMIYSDEFKTLLKSVRKSKDFAKIGVYGSIMLIFIFFVQSLKFFLAKDIAILSALMMIGAIIETYYIKYAIKNKINIGMFYYLFGTALINSFLSLIFSGNIFVVVSMHIAIIAQTMIQLSIYKGLKSASERNKNKITDRAFDMGLIAMVISSFFMAVKPLMLVIVSMLTTWGGYFSWVITDSKKKRR